MGPDVQQDAAIARLDRRVKAIGLERAMAVLGEEPVPMHVVDRRPHEFSGSFGRGRDLDGDRHQRDRSRGHSDAKGFRGARCSIEAEAVKLHRPGPLVGRIVYGGDDQPGRCVRRVGRLQW